MRELIVGHRSPHEESNIDPARTTIRLANSYDSPPAWRIRDAAIRSRCKRHYSVELLAAWTHVEDERERGQFAVGPFYVACLDQVVVGTGLIDLDMERDLNSGQLDAIFVRPDLMGNGIGKQIVEFLEDLARAHGLTRLTLDSTLNAASFYRSCGFVGDVVGIHHSPLGISLDCIPMIKQLLPRRDDEFGEIDEAQSD